MYNKFKQLSFAKKAFSIFLLIILLFSFCMCSLMTALIIDVANDTPAPTSLPTITLTPTTTLTPSTTPVPSNTPVPTSTKVPSRTPTKTSTPTPTRVLVETITPTPSSTPDEAAENYKDSILSIFDVYTESFGVLEGYMYDASLDSSLIVSDTWRNMVADQFSFILLANEELRSITPPPNFEKTHEHLIDAANHYDLGIALFSDGLDDMDSYKIISAVEEFDAGTLSISLANDELERLIQRGVVK